jgi:hypothetical protein
VQNEQVREHRADHDHAQQRRAEELRPRNDDEDGSGDLEQSGDEAKPLTNPDRLVEIVRVRLFWNGNLAPTSAARA